jgi:hypothetical protein
MGYETPLMISLYLSPDHREYAENLAQDTFEKYQNVKGHYRNLLSSHVIGRYGEMGAYQFFINRQIDAYPYFSNIEYDNLCDINTKLGRCEVKTWNPDFWDDWGRAISVGQMPYLEKKADFILWCTAEEVQGLIRVSIHGWNRIEDMKVRSPIMTGPEGKQVENYQLKVEELRSLDTLRLP